MSPGIRAPISSTSASTSDGAPTRVIGRPISALKFPGVAWTRNRGRSDAAIIEGERAAADRLTGLRALAGDHDHVTGARSVERFGDGGTPVELDDDRRVALSEPGKHGVGDRLRILRPRVVRGEHREVGA